MEPRRTIVLSDVRGEPPTPQEGFISVFQDHDLSLYSKNEDGDIELLGGNLERAWVKLSGDPGPPTSTDAITRPTTAQVAVGRAAGYSVPSPVLFDLNGSARINGVVYLLPVSTPSSVSGASSVYQGADSFLHYRSAGGVDTRLDIFPYLSGMTKVSLGPDERLTIPPDFQYLIRGTFSIGLGAELTIGAGAELVFL